MKTIFNVSVNIGKSLFNYIIVYLLIQKLLLRNE